MLEYFLTDQEVRLHIIAVSDVAVFELVSIAITEGLHDLSSIVQRVLADVEANTAHRRLVLQGNLRIHAAADADLEKYAGILDARQDAIDEPEQGKMVLQPCEICENHMPGR